jgi:hypothetical protein
MRFINCTTPSVAARVRPTPVQVPVQVEEEVAPPTSKEAVEPDGGKSSTNVTANAEPALPERLIVNPVLPAVPPNA